MKKLLLTLALTLPLSLPAQATIDEALANLYSSISGEAGAPRDEARFKSIFWPGAQLMAAYPDSTGKWAVRVMEVDEFFKNMSGYVQTHSFFEEEIARRTEQWDHMAHAWSTYVSRHHPGEEPFDRGINSIQLFWDGARWWVTNIYWQPEITKSSLPKVYLPKGRRGK